MLGWEGYRQLEGPRTIHLMMNQSWRHQDKFMVRMLEAEMLTYVDIYRQVYVHVFDTHRFPYCIS